MSRRLTIKLDRIDVRQLLDLLEIRAYSWRKTADFMESGYIPDDSFACEECTGADEAIATAEHYQRILSSIEKQLAKQRGWE